MYLGRVVGRVWSTVKNAGLESQRLLIVQPLTPELKPTGRKLVVTDCMGAGASELVYWVKGKEASFPFLPDEVPTDISIVGIVDEMRVKRQRPSSPAKKATP
jgi:ethanolamine utilization protein EutN